MMKKIINNKKKTIVKVCIGLLLALSFLQACGELPTEESHGFMLNAQHRRISWHKKDLPITLSIHKAFPVEYLSDVERAVEYWNKEFRETVGYEVFVIDEDGHIQDKPQHDGHSFIYWIEDWIETYPYPIAYTPEEKRGQGSVIKQGVTTNYWKGDYIDESDIRINGEEVKFFTDTDKPEYRVGKVHMKSLMIHELGHMLGLGHNEIKDPGGAASVMNPVLFPGVVRDVLRADDREALFYEYII